MHQHDRTSNGLVKRCRVCGDKSLGFNFNGLSCESCKAFFRRNALRHQELACPKNGNCKIDITTRKFCQLCRLNKCFDIGMKKELILTKEDKNWKHKTNENVQPNQDDDSKPIIVAEQCTTNSSQFIVPKEEFSSDQVDSKIDKLSPYELRHIEIINQLAKRIFPDERTLKVTGRLCELIKVINMNELYIPKVIAFAKGIEAFRDLNKDDQLVIIKAYFTGNLILRGSFSYSWENDAFLIVANEIGDQVVQANFNIFYQTNQKNQIHQYRKLVHLFNIEMEQDEVILNLLCAILLFSHNCNTSCPEYIMYQYHFNCHLLLRYLQTKYQCTAKAMAKYHNLLQVLQQIPSMIKVVYAVYSDIDSKQIARLVAEIYNLE